MLIFAWIFKGEEKTPVGICSPTQPWLSRVEGDEFHPGVALCWQLRRLPYCPGKIPKICFRAILGEAEQSGVRQFAPGSSSGRSQLPGSHSKGWKGPQGVCLVLVPASASDVPFKREELQMGWKGRPGISVLRLRRFLGHHCIWRWSWCLSMTSKRNTPTTRSIWL